MIDNQRRPKPHDAPPWREILSQARAHPCPQCGSQGPHQPRCTPWVIHWGEVRCGACAAHVRWLPKPPDTDKGAWRLYTEEFCRAWARYNLEEYLDSLGLRWRHESHALLLIGAVDRPAFTQYDLPPDQRARIRALIAAVREAHGWAEKMWLWPDVQPSSQVDLFTTPAEPQP